MMDANDTRTWLRWVRSRFGPEKSQERHVAREIAEYMTPDGRNAYPTQESVAEAVGTGVRAVRDAIAGIVRGQWARIERRKRGKGRHGYSNTYIATYPDHVAALVSQGHTKPPRRDDADARPTGSAAPVGHSGPSGSPPPVGAADQEADSARPRGRIAHDQEADFDTTNRQPTASYLSEGNYQKEPSELASKQQPARPPEIDGDGDADQEQHIRTELKALGVVFSKRDRYLSEWIAKGFTLDQLKAKVRFTRGYRHKPEPMPIFANYLAAVVHDETAIDPIERILANRPPPDAEHEQRMREQDEANARRLEIAAAQLIAERVPEHEIFDRLVKSNRASTDAQIRDAIASQIAARTHRANGATTP